MEPSTGGEYKYHLKDHLHVIKLETFLVKPTTKVKLWGNHIDGNKFNNKLDNLEWASPSMNIIHAYHNGLRTDNFTGMLKDLSDSSVKSFVSLRDCAIWLGINPGKLHRYLNGKREYPLCFKHAVWLTGEEPSKLTKEDVGRAPRGGISPWKMREKVKEGEETLPWKYFACDFRLAKVLGITVTKLLEFGEKGEIEDVKSPSLDYRHCTVEFEKIKDYEEYLVALKMDEEFKKDMQKKNFTTSTAPDPASIKRVSVTNHLTGIVQEYQSVHEFAKLNSFYVAEINRALKTKNAWSVFVFTFLE